MAGFFSCLKTLFTCLLYVSEICTINENEKGMNLTAKADGGRARIEIKGMISQWRDTESSFTSQIDELIRSGVRDVHIYINSPGGECMEANEIVNVIKKFPGKITGEGGAMVASAATYIAINCEEFTMPENGFFMIHQISGGVCGKETDIESYLSMMRKLNEHYLNAFLAKCKDKKKLKEEWGKGDYWMTAKEAHENGFVTAVSGKAKIDKATAQAIMNCGYTGSIEITDKNSNEKTKNDMDLTMLTNRLGMETTSTEAQVLAQIDVYKRKAERTDMLERREEQRREQEINDLLDGAVKDRKITADVRDEWKEMLQSNFDSAKKMLVALKPVEIPKVVVPGATDTTGKTFEDLQKDPSALEKLMDENSKEYERLLNEYVKKNGK